MSWKIFAQDEGTGLDATEDADYGDGASFAAMAHDSNAADYAPKPPTATSDFTIPEVTLTESQYRITAKNVSEKDRGTDANMVTWPLVTFAVHAPNETLSLTDNAVNHIYVDLTLTGARDQAGYVVNTTGTAPNDPSLKVAEVDTSNNTVEFVCIEPDGRFGYLDIKNAMNNAVYQSITDVPSELEEKGSIVFTKDEGLYVFK
jgi:hypothetical protein